MRSSTPSLVAALACVAFAAPAGAAPASDPSAVATHTKRSTAFISARINDRSEAIGSGVILSVSPNVIVLTARHLAARKNLTLRSFAGESLHIVAEYEVADRDLALLVANGPCTGCEAAETTDAITVGQPIHVWGNPQGRPYVRAPGTIVDLQPAIPGFATNGRFALACDACTVGDSGGGVFDDRGRLLGIVTEGWDGLNAGAKRVIAEPANQALARVQLAYVAPAPERPRVRRDPWIALAGLPDRAAAYSTCLAAAYTAHEVEAGIDADRKTRDGASRSGTQTAKLSARKALQSCVRLAP